MSRPIVPLADNAAYKPGVVRQQDLAGRYGVAIGTISQIIRRVRWSYVA